MSADFSWLLRKRGIDVEFKREDHGDKYKDILLVYKAGVLKARIFSWHLKYRAPSEFYSRNELIKSHVYDKVSS